MRAEQYREHFEQLLLRVSAEVIGEDGEFFLDALDSRPSEARIRFTSRSDSDRTAGLRLDTAWLEAFFFLGPNLSILMLDDYADDDEYATERLREVVQVVHAYLRGEGSLESRRTVLGGRRPQMRFQVGGREWLAR
jgi:hypothetical protein